MDISQNKIPKKRGRKPKNAVVVNQEFKKNLLPKKGRKPKGGKIIVNNVLKPTNTVHSF